MYKKRVYILSIQILLALGFVGCVKPTYVPPPDPFGESKLDNLLYSDTLNKARERSEKWSQIINKKGVKGKLTKQESADLTADFNTDLTKQQDAIKELSQTDSVAGRFALSKYRIAMSDLLERVTSNKFMRQGFLQVTSKENLDDFIKRNRETRIQEILALNQLARMGYQPAITEVAKYGLPAPLKDLNTPLEDQARRDYEEKLKQYNKDQKAAAAIIGGAAVIGTAIAAAKYGGGSGGSSYPATADSGTTADDLDLRGCCSWHNGVKRDFLDKPVCFVGKVVCKDELFSPTCVCNQ